MEWFFAACSSFYTADTPVFLGLLLAGLLGSISHCSLMCAPIAAAHMLDATAKGRPDWLMLLYHGGRVITYGLLGLLAATASSLIFSDVGAQTMQPLLFVAGAVFLFSALAPRRSHGCNKHSPYMQKLKALLPASPALQFYLRGMLLGLMPCGMVIAALLLAATLPVWQAPLGMMLFGLATVPMLQLTGYGALRLDRRFPRSMRAAGRSVMALCGVVFWVQGLGMLTIL